MVSDKKIRQAKSDLILATSKLKHGITMKGGGATYEKMYGTAYDTLAKAGVEGFRRLRGKYRP